MRSKKTGNSREVIKKPISTSAAKKSSVQKKQIPSEKKIEKTETVTKNNPISKIPNRVPIKKLQQKPVFNQKNKQPKQQLMKQMKWGYLPFFYLHKISEYACTTPMQVYRLSRVCLNWRVVLMSQGGQIFWERFKGFQNAQNSKDVFLLLQKHIKENQQKMSFEFQKNYTKLFNYGSTKQNIPNKLIDKMGLQLYIVLNKKRFFQPFKLRSFNFSSYLCTKIQQIKQYKYDFYTPHNMFKDNIEIELTFRSKKYKVAHTISKKYVPQQVTDGAIKQKAFNFFLDKNIVLTYFEGDNHFLYIFFEISLLQLVTIFRTIIKNKHKESIDRKNKGVPLYKQLYQTQFDDFQQYIKCQADFQVHFSYHNSIKQIFTHCDTKVFPIQYDKKHAYFQVKIDDSFEKAACYKLDNKIGMSESIDDLYMMDFVLKDRERFLISFSGFVYARKATQKQRQSIQDYFNFAQNQVRVIEAKQEKYSINIIFVEEHKKNLMKTLKLNLIP